MIKTAFSMETFSFLNVALRNNQEKGNLEFQS